MDGNGWKMDMIWACRAPLSQIRKVSIHTAFPFPGSGVDETWAPRLRFFFDEDDDCALPQAQNEKGCDPNNSF